MYYEEFNKPMVEIHPESVSESGKYEITYGEGRELDALSKLMNPEYAGQLDQTICVLRDMEKREIVMSDSWMEQETNIGMVRQAKGHVLIAGLGMGMIVLAMQELEEVESITVVEIDQEIIDFITPNLDLYDKVKIVCSDIHDFVPDRQYDTVYCDIWNDISGANFEEMEELTCALQADCKGEVKHWRYTSTYEMYEEDNGEWYA